MPDQFCQHCGNALQPEDRFCMACGQPVNGAQTRSTAPAVPPASPPYAAGSYPPQMPAPMPPYAAQPIPPTPRKQNGLAIALIAVGVVIILAAGLFAGYRLLGGRQTPPDATDRPIITASESDSPSQTTPVSTTTSAPSASESTTASSETPSIETTTTQPAADTTSTTEPADDIIRRTDGLPEAYTYAPLPGRSYLYEVVYPDGETGYEQIVIGQQGDVLSSTITFFDDSGYGGDDYDFDSREDGIYIVYPAADYQSLWLPHDYQEFDLWELEWETYMIMAVDQTVASGTYTFEDVLVRYYENTAADYHLTEYLVPGHGVVYAESSPGVPVRTLIEWSEIGIDAANQQFYR